MLWTTATKGHREAHLLLGRGHVSDAVHTQNVGGRAILRLLQLQTRGALMPSPTRRENSSVLRFSTDDVPTSKRLTFWREVFGRSAVRANVEPRSIETFSARALMEAVPGLRITSLASTAASIERSAHMLDDEDDSLVLLTPEHGSLTVAQRGREVTLRPREAVVVLHNEPSFVTHDNARFRGLVVPRRAIASALGNVEDSTMRHIPVDAPALRLLLHYVGGISEEVAHTSEWTKSMIGAHVHDLIAIVSSHETEPSLAKIDNANGLRAAQLAAIQAHIVTNIGLAEVTIADVAARHRLAPRTIQRLFEEQGSTFSAFKLEQQLFYARRLLGSNSLAHPTIADIAYAAGFSDLSYFHRCFRHRFGMTPAEFRAQANDP